MAIVLDQSERDFLEQLNKLQSATIAQICDALGVTATAVRQRLTRLQEENYIARTKIVSGRGRPHHEYHLTDKGRKQLGDNYSELALVLWRELSKIEDPTIKQNLIDSLKTSMVSRYGDDVNAVSSKERLAQLKQTLQEKGFRVEIDFDRELPILREKNCPYLELASNDPSICELEKTVFEEILGTSITLTQCCLDGHNCCEFEVSHNEIHPTVNSAVNSTVELTNLETNPHSA